MIDVLYVLYYATQNSIFFLLTHEISIWSLDLYNSLIIVNNVSFIFHWNCYQQGRFFILKLTALEVLLILGNCLAMIHAEFGCPTNRWRIEQMFAVPGMVTNRNSNNLASVT